MKSGLKVTMKDVREAKMCSSGARAFFTQHNLNWQEFLKDGVAIEELEAIDDSMVKKVTEAVRNGQS